MSDQQTPAEKIQCYSQQETPTLMGLAQILARLRWEDLDRLASELDSNRRNEQCNSKRRLTAQAVWSWAEGALDDG